MPGGKIYHNASTLGEKIYVYGGSSNVYIYDGVSWTEGTPLNFNAAYSVGGSTESNLFLLRDNSVSFLEYTPVRPTVYPFSQKWLDGNSNTVFTVDSRGLIPGSSNAIIVGSSDRPLKSIHVSSLNLSNTVYSSTNIGSVSASLKAVFVSSDGVIYFNTNSFSLSNSTILLNGNVLYGGTNVPFATNSIYSFLSSVSTSASNLIGSTSTVSGVLVVSNNFNFTGELVGSATGNISSVVLSGLNKSWKHVSSSPDGIKLAAVADSVYTSVDAGTNWVSKYVLNGWSKIGSSTNGLILIAARSGGIYVSYNGGTDWELRSDPVTLNGNGGVDISYNGQNVVVCSSSGFIYTSTDAGTNWTQRGLSKLWKDVASSSDGSKLVACSQNSYIYTSIDAGTNWTQRNVLGYWLGVSSSSDGTRLIAADYTGGLHISHDAGTNWFVASIYGVSGWVSVASSEDGLRLAAISSSYIYTSIDGGLNWTQRDSSNPNRYCLASSFDGKRLVVGLNPGELYIDVLDYDYPSLFNIKDITFSDYGESVIGSFEKPAKAIYTIDMHVSANTLYVGDTPYSATTVGSSNNPVETINVISNGVIKFDTNTLSISNGNLLVNGADLLASVSNVVYATNAGNSSTAGTSYYASVAGTSEYSSIAAVALNVTEGVTNITYESTNIYTYADSGSVFRVTITNNVILRNPNNSVDGQAITWWVRQDSIGEHTVDLDTHFKIPASASLPLSWYTNANGMTMFVARYDALITNWYVLSLVPGY